MSPGKVGALFVLSTLIGSGYFALRVFWLTYKSGFRKWEVGASLVVAAIEIPSAWMMVQMIALLWNLK